jgi:metal-responsive CopG/Arc/MetJ family transcriptional regulator
MTVRKFTISLPEELYADIERLAERDGLSISAWIAHAVGHEIRLAAMDDAIAYYEAEYGPISEEAVEAAERELDEAWHRAQEERRPHSRRGRS